MAPTTNETRIYAEFSPQVWVGDYAFSVDPQGDTVWDATAAFHDLKPEYQALLLAEIDEDGYQALDIDDRLKDDPNAPEWVREWSGPFSLYVSLDNESGVR